MRAVRFLAGPGFPRVAALLSVVVLGTLGCGQAPLPSSETNAPVAEARKRPPPPESGPVSEAIARESSAMQASPRAEPASPELAAEPSPVPPADPTPAPDLANLTPAEAFEALGATLKRNVKGELLSVDLKETEVTDAVLRHFREMPRLKTLNLSLTGVTDEGLANLRGLTSLKQLYLFGTETTDAGLAHLSGLAAIEVLCLDETRVTDAGLVHLAGLTELRKLHLKSRGTITDAGLESLATLTHLVELRIAGTDVTEQGVSQLDERLPNCEIVR